MVSLIPVSASLDDPKDIVIMRLNCSSFRRMIDVFATRRSTSDYIICGY